MSKDSNPKMIKWEHRTEILLARNFVLDVLYIQIASFEKLYGYRPNKAMIDARLAGPIAKELIQQHGFKPSDAVAQPLWYKDVMCTYHINMNDVYLILTNTHKEGVESL